MGPGRRLSGRQEVRARGDRTGEDERGDHENNVPLGGRVLGHVRLYGQRGRGDGGTDSDTGTMSIDEGKRASTKGSTVELK